MVGELFDVDHATVLAGTSARRDPPINLLSRWSGRPGLSRMPPIRSAFFQAETSRHPVDSEMDVGVAQPRRVEAAPVYIRTMPCELAPRRGAVALGEVDGMAR
jgi:hypothetical protein